MMKRRDWVSTTSGAVAAGLVKARFDALDLLAQKVRPSPSAVPDDRTGGPQVR